jgi:hypothetical protein
MYSKLHSNSTSFHSVHIGGVRQWSDELDRDVTRVESLHGSTPSTHVDPDGYESPVSEDGDISQDANCARDLTALAQRKNPDTNADCPDGSQQPHAREIPQKERERVRVREEGIGRGRRQ